MDACKKLKSLIIIILGFICLTFLIAFFSIVIIDIPVFSSLFDEFFTSGNSIFIPPFPYINIVWFLPEKNHLVQFSVGHLIDFIIIISIVNTIETSLYHYITRVCLNGNTLMLNYIDLYSTGSKKKLDERSQCPNKVFGFNVESINYLDDNFLDYGERGSQLSKRNDRDYSQFRRKRYKSNIIQDILLNRKSKFIFNKLYKNLQVSCDHSIFDNFWFSLLIYLNLHPKIYNITDSNEFRREGG
ncbi:hypothetical protein LCGC14_0877060 [marine sediment metagenome]|uniref:Uncharacterized protein n=1 Tax=marine sediment metagenome TaxID=412755 RepID=A0A0F9P2Y3_9ZZZZ